ncbi:MAG: hypothetical protein AAGK97_17180, partial [Bacteroidota bacterium]
VESAPILCTVVEGEGENARFVPITSAKDWPVLSIEYLPDNQSKELNQHAKLLMNQQIRSLQEGGKDAHRKSLRFSILKSEKKIALVMVTPHHFLDGVGIATFIAKFIMLCILPKFLWNFAILRKCPKEMPTFLEMPFKKSFNNIKDRLIPNLEMRTPYNYFFPEHDFTDPKAPNKLKGINGMLSISSSQIVNKVRAALRKEGLSISIAFSALAVKLLAVLLKKYNANPQNKKITSSTGTDMRQFSNWGYNRDRKTRQQFPIEGNFTCKQNYTFEFEQALKMSFIMMAKEIKQDMERLHHDEAYRIDRVLNQWNEPVMVYPGVSSVLAPKVAGEFLLRNIALESTIDFGPVPRVWFYVLTSEGGTSLKADIALP